MSKNKSHQLARMALGRKSDPPITNKELYSVSPPKLTERELSHFSFGQVTVDHFFSKISPILEACHHAHQAAGVVSRILNNAGQTTACGEKWTPRLAWFAMKTWRDAQSKQQSVPRRTSREEDGASRASKRLDQARYHAHLKLHFKNPTIGETFPVLGDLLATLRDQEKS